MRRDLQLINKYFNSSIINIAQILRLAAIDSTWSQGMIDGKNKSEELLNTVQLLENAIR